MDTGNRGRDVPVFVCPGIQRKVTETDFNVCRQFRFVRN